MKKTSKNIFGKIGKKLRSTNVVSLIVFVVLLIYSVVILYHLFWAVTTSLKTNDDVMWGKSYALPSGGIFAWEWGNYKTMYNAFSVTIQTSKGSLTYNLWNMLFNSLIYTFGGAFIATAVPYVVAYITSRYKYWFCKLINTIVIVAISLPIVGNTPSMIAMLNNLYLYDTFAGILILQGSFLTMYYLVHYAAFSTISNEYYEAASIDGASEFTIMLRIMFPMASSTFFTVFLIMVVSYWNDYQGPILYLKSIPVLARTVYNTISNYSAEMSDTPNRMAMCMLLVAPILVVFSIFSGKIMGNVSMGGLKE